MNFDNLTPLERYADELVRWENLERYMAQSQATQDGQRAELPERPRLEAFAR